MISIKNLTKEWQDFSIEDINLEVKNQEYFVVLGPTGAGKTLLLELIAGFHEPDQGEIKIGGTEVSELSPQERNVGFVYQDYSLFPHLKVEENIRFGPSVQGSSESDVSAEAEKIMNMLDIKHLANRYPRNLSGGEQQKVALARGLMIDPKVLLLDEPISALDVPSQEKIRKELRKVHQESGITTLHVTHNREEALSLGNRIGAMKGGRIVQVGTPEEIFREPKSDFIANFVGTENVFKGESQVSNGIVRIDIGGGVELEAISEREGDLKACIRPEEIIVSEEPIQSSGRNMLEGKIVGISERERTVRLRIDAGRVFTVTVTKRSRSDMDLKTGKKVYIAFKASSIHVI